MCKLLSLQFDYAPLAVLLQSTLCRRKIADSCQVPSITKEEFCSLPRKMICDVPLIDSEIQESALKFLYFCHIALQVSVYLKISM